MINIREKVKNDKNSNDYPRKLTLINNNFNDNLRYVIKHSKRPNYMLYNQEYKVFDFSSPLSKDNNTSRNNPKQNRTNSYVNELLKDSFVLWSLGKIEFIIYFLSITRDKLIIKL